MSVLYGTIGTSWITRSWIHATAQTPRTGPHFQLHSIYSRSESSAAALLSALSPGPGTPIPTHTSLETFLADTALQAVYIASPNSLHYAHAAQALRAGKHVLLEKPACAQPAQWDALVALARAHGVVLLEAYRHLQEANYIRLQQHLSDSTLLGPLLGASLTYTSRSSRFDALLDPSAACPNIFSRTFEGGALVDVGVYPLAFAIGLFGAPSSHTYSATLHPRSGTDVAGVATLRYARFAAQIHVSKAYSAANNGVEIFGERGTLRVDATAGIASIRFTPAGESQARELAHPPAPVSPPDVSMVEEATAFARAIVHDDQPFVERLQRLSRAVLVVTADMRRQAGVVYDVDGEGAESTGAGQREGK